MKNKTWSRELAVILLLFLCYLAYTGERSEELRILAIPAFSFAGLAFSFRQPVVGEWLRWKSPESVDRGRSECSCEYASWEDEPANRGVFHSRRTKAGTSYSRDNNSDQRYPEGKG